MKTISSYLLNCRVKLEPNSCETFLKFLRICYGLGNVSVSYDEAVDLYVNISKNLYGQNTTMESL